MMVKYVISMIWLSNFIRRNQIRSPGLTQSHPVVLDSLVEHGGQSQLGLLTDVGAADDEPDPVGLVERDAHVRLNLRDWLTEYQTALVVISSINFIIIERNNEGKIIQLLVVILKMSAITSPLKSVLWYHTGWSGLDCGGWVWRGNKSFSSEPGAAYCSQGLIWIETFQSTLPTLWGPWFHRLASRWLWAARWVSTWSIWTPPHHYCPPTRGSRPAWAPWCRGSRESSGVPGTSVLSPPPW